jgi:LPS O-antigen subunit length determinant protein (WzzB/FepE family)
MQTTTKDIFYFTSINLQRKIFFENDYLTALNPKNEPIDDVEGYFLSFINSISIQAPVTKQTKDETVGNLLEKPYSVSLKGRNDKIISSFLNELAASANSETVDDLINIIKQKIGIRLDEISKEHGLLLTGAQRDRLSQIERIKEEDGQKIREINDQIDALRLKALRDRLSEIERIKEEDGQKIREINDQIDALRYRAQQVRLNQITILSKAAKLAGSLGIIENNLKQISESESNFNLNIAINDDEDDLPEWYLYGEKALLERVELLESVTSDDPFIPELVTLTNQLKEIQNNNTLKTLEERQNDDPFVPEIIALKKTLMEVQLNNTLKTLQEREDDDPFIPEIITLQKTLKEIQNNNTLKTLEEREDDDPFIPEIIALQKTLKEIQNNNTLKTLEERQDDSPFIARINELDIERINLESFDPSPSGIDAMQLTQPAVSTQIPNRNRLIIALALIGGFMFSIVLALLTNLFKEDETEPTTK